MKVTQVSIQQTEAAKAAGRPVLTPELLAASAARYSRNNEGLEAILKRIDPDNLDRSVDSIFRMLDYGHQSIADMVPVAMFMDGISIWLAYYVWTLCPTAGGQESSTRYIEMGPEALVPAELLGIPEHILPEWQDSMNASFDAYRKALELWDGIGKAYPELTSIPPEVLADESEKGRKKVLRMQRNYRFDRARCYLPVACATNMMLIMSARGWARLCQHLSSHPLPEAQLLADRIRAELKLSAPRLMRHAQKTDSIVQGIAREWDALVKESKAGLPPELAASGAAAARTPDVTLSISCPSELGQAAGAAFADALQFHDNRYAWQGSALERTAVRFRCEAISLGEIRDLNRHRTGSKYCPMRPLGFYSSLDQLPAGCVDQSIQELRELNEVGRKLSSRMHELVAKSEHTSIYWSLLGTQYLFEHLTTADKFIYEAELRTGMGSHFRYAKHLKDALQKWYALYPETKGMIKEGDAEPE